MKPTILIFCGEDTAAAEAVARSLRDGSRIVGLRSVATSSLAFEIEACDEVIIMPDVPAWQRQMIERVYPGLTRAARAPTFRAPLTAKHRGRGRWFVMRGAEIVSGPHTKQEAQERAA